MDVVEATREFERWLSGKVDVVRDQLREKHERMAASPVEFLRGTFYRWAQCLPENCPDFGNAPRVLAIGDLHIASFGTWRDEFGRLIWGVDDFDEACRLPYANDLIRLAVSAVLDAWEGEIKVDVKDVCGTVLDGYRSSLSQGGRALVLEERHKWLRKIALEHLDKPATFWNKLDALPTSHAPIPAGARAALARILPKRGIEYRIARRTSGIGSLGHPRYVAIFDWEGAQLAFEAKEMVPSAWTWAHPEQSEGIQYDHAMDCGVRCKDPFVRVIGKWLVRHLSPDSSPIEIESMSGLKQQERLLHAMAWEAANIHLGSQAEVRAVAQDLKTRSAKSWRRAVKQMVICTLDDWRRWKRAHKARTK